TEYSPAQLRRAHRRVGPLQQVAARILQTAGAREAVEDDEPQLPRARLLVAVHGVDQLVEHARRVADGQAEGGEQAAVPDRRGVVEAARGPCQFGGEDQPDAHRVAVPPAVALAAL